MKRSAFVITACAILSLSACSSILPQGNAFDIYQLPTSAASVAANTAPAVDWQLRVDSPEASSLLSSSRILVEPKPGLVSIYHGARWAQRTPQLLRDRLINAFHANGQVHGISSDDDGLIADYKLDSTLRAFQAEYQGSGAPVVVLQLDARLVRSGSKRILAARRFDVTERAAGTNVAQVVTAFGQAADKLSSKLVAWTLSQAQSDWQTQDNPAP